MRLRNNIFAAALDYLKREKGIKTQKQLAQLMGVSEDTITRILKDRCDVTEDIITKLQTASGCIFNLQWLRGEDSEHMLVKDVVEEKPTQPFIDPSSYINSLIAEHTAYVNYLTDDLKKKEIVMQQRLAEKDARIEDLQRNIADLQRTIADKETIIKDKESRISYLERKLASITISDFERYPFTIGAAEDKKQRKHL